MIDEPVYVDINNVARWVFLRFQNEDLPELATLSPPFPEGVYEYFGGHWLDFLGHSINVPNPKVRVVASALELEEPGVGDVSVLGEPLQLWREAEWIVDWIVYVEDIQIGFAMRQLNGMGESSTDGNYNPIGGREQFFLVDDSEDVAIFINLILWPVFVATSFMHCRNVNLIDKPISRQYRRHLERQGKPVIQYKTLDIEPFKTQVRNETAESGENEIERALHICRGHFATYTEDAPLFGKHVGTFWKPMHVRGSADAGKVEKDYRVIADNDPG